MTPSPDIVHVPEQSITDPHLPVPQSLFPSLLPPQFPFCALFADPWTNCYLFLRNLSIIKVLIDVRKRSPRRDTYCFDGSCKSTAVRSRESIYSHLEKCLSRRTSKQYFYIIRERNFSLGIFSSRERRTIPRMKFETRLARDPRLRLSLSNRVKSTGTSFAI